MSENEDKKSRFSIDVDNLDQEWLAQPQHAFDILKRVAELEYAYADAKKNFELVENNISNSIRSNTAEKITENGIKAKIVLHPDYQAAYEKENMAEKQLGVAKAAAVAIEHKKRALEHLVMLKRQEYYSSPTEPREKPVGVDNRVRK